MFPLEINTNELPAAGGLALLPVVQYSSVAVLLIIAQAMPSMLTVTVVPNPTPTRCKISPPILGPNAGEIVLTIVVEA